MKFKSQNDVQLFLVEVGRIDLVNTANADYKPSEELLEKYIKKRKPLVSKLKDFRKSQDSKHAWHKNRAKNMAGIKKFHNSTAGKKFHRSLGRFLATRDFRGGEYKRESLDATTIHEVCEVLKALSSLKTHALIEFDYYHTMEDEIDLCNFVEELLPKVSKIESALVMSNGSISADELEYMTRLCDFDSLVLEIASIKGIPEKEVRAAFESVLGTMNESDTPYLSTLNKLKESLCK